MCTFSIPKATYPFAIGTLVWSEVEIKKGSLSESSGLNFELASNVKALSKFNPKKKLVNTLNRS